MGIGRMKLRKMTNNYIWRRGICLLGSLALFAGSLILPSPALAMDADAGMESGEDGSIASASEEEIVLQEDSAEDVIMVDPTGDSEGYSAVLYDNTNGLPTSEANAIAETSEGFIWIGGYSGLIRYDGNTFERFDSTTGIGSVVCLFVDSQDHLWIGTNDSGVVLMEKGELHMFKKAEGLTSLSIRSIVEAPDGDIYIGTTQGIAVVDEELKLHMIDDTRIKDRFMRELRIGPDGVIYGVTQDGAVVMIRDGQITGFYESTDLGLNGILSVTPDLNLSGYVYFGTEQSEIYRVDFTNGIKLVDTIDVSPLAYMDSVELLGDQIWVCADNGIGMVENGKVKVLENIPMNNSIDRMMVDYEGNLWFTSSRQGVMKIVPNQFMDVFDRYELDSTVVNSTCMQDGYLYIGTDNGLTVLSQNKTVRSLPITKLVSASGEDMLAASEEEEGETDENADIIEDNKNEQNLISLLDGCRIRSIIRDSKDQIWISTYSDYGLIRYDNGVTTCFTSADGMPSNRIRAIYERKDGSIMAACRGGMALIREDQVEHVYNEEDGINNTEILTVTEAENGDMLIGSDGDGIYVIGEDRFLHINTDSGLSSDIVMRIKPGVKQNVYWIVTSNSLSYLDADYKVTMIQDFPYSNNYDLYENSKGEVWVLSSNGIYVTTADELIEDDEITPIFYGRDNGLSCTPTANSYSEVTKDGDLYISGSTGVSKVNIERPFEEVDDLKMAVPYVDADGERIFPDASGNYEIPAKVKRLTIYSYVYNYTLMNPQVTYYLNGFDETQTTVRRSELSALDYTNLRGGTYHFIMQLQDPMGNSSKTLSVQIVKKEKLYEMLWFNILCVIVGVLLLAEIVSLIVRRKLKAIQKKEEEQRALIREITRAFAKTIDMKDRYTNGHSVRVAKYTAMLTKELGYDEETVEKYYNIALLHDIGKIGIPPEVLNKQGKLTDEEFDIIKSHTRLGYNALRDITIMPELAIGAGAHHERPDGKGYPRGLMGDEIPRVAQIIAAADTFDAMYSDRPYRKRMNFEKVVSIMKEVSGTQLTPDVVDAFLRLVEQGEFRDPSDHGGGTTEDIDNIRKHFDKGESTKSGETAVKKVEGTESREAAAGKGESGEAAAKKAEGTESSKAAAGKGKSAESSKAAADKGDSAESSKDNK